MDRKKNIKIADIEPNKGQIEGLPQNPRFIKDNRFKQLVKSIEDAPEMLDPRPLIVYPHEKKYVIIAGNMRYRACKELGYKELPCYVLPEETPAEKLREYAIKDNIGFGADDWDILMNEWDTEELKDWGMEMPDDWSGNNGEETEVVEDEVPEDVETRCKRGYVWKLGEHRLMCGDSTKSEEVEKLMNGEKADMVFTDPPYGINIVSDSGTVGGGGVTKAGVYSKVIADDTTETAEKAYKILKSYSNKLIIWGGNYFVDFLDFSDGWIVWDKRGDMNSNNFADGEMAWCSFHTPVRIYHQLWNGMIREGEHEKRVHPTQKPIRMLSEILQDFSKENEVILDVFGGSGSTLIACEQLQRKCYTMELDEHYCDVIISRWEKLTGKKAEKIN